MPTPRLFVPNELEAHLITVHRIPPGTIAIYREHCQKTGKDYDEFLKTNHDFMHAMRSDDDTP